MRQRRNRLQVSTFPFLAVLLCAMGSLILLLLVMDRRAKVVARARAMRTMEQALSQTVAEDEKAAADRRAEWERRRQQLHQQLEQEDQQVLRDLQRIQGQATAAAGSVQQALAHSRELEGRLQAERVQLAQSEGALLAHRAKATAVAQQTEVSRTELARLTAELERMERCIADLKIARQRQQRMVSLVPYRGKHGDNRKPIYIECNGDDLIFHPDHLALHAATGAAVRSEMDRRLAQQRAEMQLVHEKPDVNAYLLMLVRPNGIATYYRTLAALKGLQIDFGYEFIDQEWILDFSEDEANPKTQPWSTAARTEEQPPPPKSSAKTTEAVGSMFSGRPQGLAPQAGSGGPILGRPTGILASRTGGAGNVTFGNGGGGGSGGGNGGKVPPGDPRDGSPIGAVPRGSGNSGFSSGGRRELTFADVLAGGGRPRGAGERSLDGEPVTASPSESVQGGPAGSQSRPAFSQAGMSASPGGLAASSGGPVASQGGPGERTGMSGATSEGQTRSGNGPSDTQSTPSQGTSDVPRGGAARESGTPAGNASSGLLPQFTPGSSPGAGNSGSGNPESGASPDPTSAKPVPVGLSQGSPPSEEPGRSGGGDPFDRFGLPSSKARPARAEAFRPRPLLGNRDWVISIECTAEGLVLLPSRQRIPTDQIARGENESNPLLEAVRQMMARRQATVRPGEPPYRPMIRFRVLPDGLRSYHLAYPALEGLQVPMTRENVDPEEAKTRNRERS